VVAVALAMLSCKQHIFTTPASTPPPKIFSGEAPFYGTVGSLAKIPLEDMRPLAVSNFAIVVDLPGTGSSEVPAVLRSRMLKQLSGGGFGLSRLGSQELGPNRVLDSLQTAVVHVEGLIPPAAPRGTRFDLLVRSISGTQTTSLEGGRILTTDMAPFGTTPGVEFSRALAKGFGRLYINPFEDDLEREKRLALSREGVILSGGTVKTDRGLRLILNQPHWKRSGLIADRINERFRKGRGDRYKTAEARDDSRIDIHIPSRWRSQPIRLLELILHLYVQRMDNFETQKARELRDLVAENPGYGPRVALAWEALGKQALPVIRAQYKASNLELGFAALTAGSFLGDERTSIHLQRLAKHSDPAVRLRTARLLVNLPDSIRAEKSLRGLLNDEDNQVRIAAYKALDQHNNGRFIKRILFKDIDGKPRFLLDIVDSQRPLIYIAQINLPRIVIFNGYTGFKGSSVNTIWRDRNEMIVKVIKEDQPVSVYYQAPDAPTSGKIQTIAPAVANLVLLMARNPKVDNAGEGFALDYSRVVNALYQLSNRGVIGAELELERTQLAQLIADVRRDQIQPDEERPELGSSEPLGEQRPETTGRPETDPADKVASRPKTP